MGVLLAEKQAGLFEHPTIQLVLACRFDFQMY